MQPEEIRVRRKSSIWRQLLEKHCSEGGTRGSIHTHTEGNLCTLQNIAEDATSRGVF